MYTKLDGQYSDGIVIFSETMSLVHVEVCVALGQIKRAAALSRRWLNQAVNHPCQYSFLVTSPCSPSAFDDACRKRKQTACTADRSISLATGRALLRSLALSRISAGHLGMIPLKRWRRLTLGGALAESLSWNFNESAPVLSERVRNVNGLYPGPNDAHIGCITRRSLVPSLQGSAPTSICCYGKPHVTIRRYVAGSWWLTSNRCACILLILHIQSITPKDHAL